MGTFRVESQGVETMDRHPIDQRPIDGSDPLPAPSPDIAAAYLEELGRVRTRREERVDRRALARHSLINAVVLAVYVAIACFAIGVGPTNSSFLIVLPLFLLWIQLSTEFRESRGALGSPIARNRTVTIGFVVILLVVVVAGFAVSLFEIAVPVPVRLIPAVLALLIMGVPALRDLRRSASSPSIAPRRPLSGPERLLTTGIAVTTAVTIWVLGSGSFMVTSIVALVVMGAYLAWWITGRVSDRVPALGAVWAWPQWTMFAAAGSAVAMIMVAQLLGLGDRLVVTAPIVAGVVLLLFVGSAFLDGRDA